jgi:hypothetical protein
MLSFFHRDLIALAPPPSKRYSTAMSTEPPKTPESPWRLNSSRVVLLVIGALALAIVASTLMGGLNSYQQLREGAKEQQAQQAAPAAEPAPAPAN